MNQGAKDSHNQFERSGCGRLSGFNRDSSGASAIEFAIVAPFLLLLLFGILGIALIYSANQALENAVAQGARMIRTGQAQSGGFDATAFKTEVCKHLTALLTCSNLKLDVRTFTNFAGSDLTNPLDASGNLKPTFSYAPGQGGDVVIVRAFYEWDLPAKLSHTFPSIAGTMTMSLGNMQNGNHLLVATQAFRNEPFK